ncbi:MAG: hypothetical protein Q7T05_02700 [Dehalococcoidia bacterium]|nr:hypothetical protein [Dehalococcoidia bacterium]
MSNRCFTRPALVLLLLSPAIGELLSSSAPPVEFFNPIRLMIFCALYGGGAILVRELKLYWRKGWLAVFLLGLAYAIVEEGLMCKSFFDPKWPDIGLLGSYGRWGGVNWVWAELLSVGHSVYSIAIPILLMELTFPNRRDEHWVSPRCAVVIAVIMALDVVLGYFGMSKYRPPMGPFLAFAALAAGLVYAAKALDWPGATVTGEPQRPVARPWKFWLVGLVGGFCFMLHSFSAPNNPEIPPLATVAVSVSIVALCGSILIRMSGNGQKWRDIHRFSAAAGALGVFIFVALIAKVSKGRTDNPTGMAAVGVVTIAMLLWLRGEIMGRQDVGT